MADYVTVHTVVTFLVVAFFVWIGWLERDQRRREIEDAARIRDVRSSDLQPGTVSGPRASVPIPAMRIGDTWKMRRPDLVPVPVVTSVTRVPDMSHVVPCVRCGATTSKDGDWYRLCGPCRWEGA